jgi:hypothetical protein
MKKRGRKFMEEGKSRAGWGKRCREFMEEGKNRAGRGKER